MCIRDRYCQGLRNNSVAILATLIISDWRWHRHWQMTTQLLSWGYCYCVCVSVCLSVCLHSTCTTRPSSRWRLRRIRELISHWTRYYNLYLSLHSFYHDVLQRGSWLCRTGRKMTKKCQWQEFDGQENDGQQHRINAVYRIIYGLPAYNEKQPYSSVSKNLAIANRSRVSRIYTNHA